MNAILAVIPSPPPSAQCSVRFSLLFVVYSSHSFFFPRFLFILLHPEKDLLIFLQLLSQCFSPPFSFFRPFHAFPFCHHLKIRSSPPTGVMYSRTHPLPASSVGLRRMPSGTVSPGTPPPSIISALSTDQFPAQISQKRHSASLVRMPNTGNGNGGASTMDPWAGAFTKTFANDRSVGEDSAKIASSAEVRPYPLVCKFVAEFVGTLIFVFIGILSAVPSNHSDSSLVLSVAFGHGLAIFVVISSLSHVSGAHLNPAVSLGIALSGKMRLLLVPFYWVAQLSGGLCAAFLVSIVTTKDQFQSIAGGATIVPSATNLWQALCAEALLTALLVFCVLSCAIDTPQNSLLAPLAIGMSISAAILGGASISGASLNPARSFGPCLVASLSIGEGVGSIGTKLTDPIWSFHFVYWVGPFIGAAFSAFLYRIFFARGDNCILKRR